jgi:hypothetical protein
MLEGGRQTSLARSNEKRALLDALRQPTDDFSPRSLSLASISMTTDEQANWRIEFEKTGEAQVRQNLSNPAIYNSPAKSDFARQWLREREAAPEQREQQTYSYTRRTLWAAVAAVLVGVIAIIIAGASWLYPNEPIPTKINPNFIYKSGSPIGHVQLFRLDQVLMGQFALRIDQAEKLNPAEVIEFHDTHCVTIAAEGEHSTVIEGRSVFTYDHIDCRIITLRIRVGESAAESSAPQVGRTLRPAHPARGGRAGAAMRAARRGNPAIHARARRDLSSPCCSPRSGNLCAGEIITPCAACPGWPR